MKKFKYTFVLLAFVIAGSAKAQTADVHRTFNKILKAYLEVKDALAADDSKLANDKAKEFTGALKELNISQLDAKQKTAWLAYSEKLRFDGEHISESDKITHQREHFASFSKNMFTVAKAFKSNSMVIYEQYCPMKNQYWLSETAAIRNPYYGKAMEDCGQTKATLSAN